MCVFCGHFCWRNVSVRWILRKLYQNMARWIKLTHGYSPITEVPCCQNLSQGFRKMVQFHQTRFHSVILRADESRSCRTGSSLRTQRIAVTGCLALKSLCHNSWAFHYTTSPVKNNGKMRRKTTRHSRITMYACCYSGKSDNSKDCIISKRNVLVLRIMHAMSLSSYLSYDHVHLCYVHKRWILSCIEQHRNYSMITFRKIDESK